MRKDASHILGLCKHYFVHAGVFAGLRCREPVPVPHASCVVEGPALAVVLVVVEAQELPPAGPGLDRLRAHVQVLRLGLNAGLLALLLALEAVPVAQATAVIERDALAVCSVEEPTLLATVARALYLRVVCKCCVLCIKKTYIYVQ